MSVKDHKSIKGLKTHNLRDHMSEAELIFTALAELSTRQVAETQQATDMQENKGAALVGGAHCQASPRSQSLWFGRAAFVGVRPA